MKKTAFLLFGAAVISAAAGGITAIGVNKYLSQHSTEGGAQESVASMWDRSEPQVGNHFTAFQAEQYPDLTYAAENAVQAVVNIECIKEVQMGGRSYGYDSFYEFFGIPYGGGYGQPQTREQRSGGSGVIISQDGYIVTNNHVVEGATEISVRLSNGNVYDAALVATDAETDLAVIKIEPKETLTIAVCGNSKSVRVGDEVLAIGNPLGLLGGTVTNGIVSALEREVTIEGETMVLLQHNAAVSPGNSGGALFNMKGELIGIVNAKYSSNGAEGLGFAIPMNTVSEVYNDLVNYGYVKGRADHGLSIVQQYAFRPGYYGYLLYIVESKYTSELVYGDRLIAINGVTPASADEAYALLDGYEIGDTVDVTVYRSGKEITVKVPISEYHP